MYELMKAALYVNGKVILGINHGDAYSKLSNEEKNFNIESGFFDLKHNEFICENEQVYFMKTIIFIRHADCQKDSKDPSITDLGRSQSKRAASFLQHLNIKSFTAFTSPVKRCQETASEFCNELNLNFQCNEDFKDQELPPSLLRNKLRKIIDDLPCKSIIITHAPIITAATELISNKIPDFIPNCSVTLFENSFLVHLGLVIG